MVPLFRKLSAIKILPKAAHHEKKAHPWWDPDFPEAFPRKKLTTPLKMR